MITIDEQAIDARLQRVLITIDEQGVDATFAQEFPEPPPARFSIVSVTESDGIVTIEFSDSDSEGVDGYKVRAYTSASGGSPFNIHVTENNVTTVPTELSEFWISIEAGSEAVVEPPPEPIEDGDSIEEDILTLQAIRDATDGNNWDNTWPQTITEQNYNDLFGVVLWGEGEGPEIGTWSVENAEYVDQELDLSSEVGSVRGHYFNPSKSIVLVVSRDPAKIIQYQTFKSGDRWGDRRGQLDHAEYVREVDISEWMGSTEEIAFSVPHGIVVNPENGKDVYVMNRREVWQFEMQEPWEIDSIVQTGYINFNNLIPSGTPRAHDIDIWRNPETGVLQFYAEDRQRQRVYQLRFGTDWDIESLIYEKEFNISTWNNETRGIEISDDGKKLFLTDTADALINEFDFGTAGDIATLTFARSYDVSSQVSNPTSITWKWDGTTFYVAGTGPGKRLKQFKSTEIVVSTGRVKELNLSGDPTIDTADIIGNGLSGQLPVELRNLKRMSHLRLKGNSLTGPIHHFIQGLQYIRYVTLSGHVLGNDGGQYEFLPHDRSRYHHAGKTNSSYNNFSEHIPNLDMLKYLEVFQLAHSPITGNLPEKLPTSIQVFAVQRSNMTGPLPKWKNCFNMTHLYLERDISSSFDSQAGPTFEGETPQEWDIMMEMAVFNLSHNRGLNPHIFPEFHQWHDIRRFSFPGRQKGAFPAWLMTKEDKNSSMHDFGGFGRMDHPLPETVASHARYTVFSYNDMRREPEEIQTFGVMPDWVNQITPIQFNCYGANFIGEHPKDLTNWHRVRNWWVYNNLFDSELPDFNIVERGENMNFYAQNAGFKGKIPDSWATFKNRDTRLRLRLQDNDLSDVIPLHLSEVADEYPQRELDELFLQNNKFTMSDIAPHYQAIKATWGNALVMFPQKPYGEANEYFLNEGTTFEIIDFLNIDTPGGGFNYRWTLNGETIEGETEPTIEWNSNNLLTEDDDGIYNRYTSHPDVEGGSAEIKSADIIIHINEDTTED